MKKTLIVSGGDIKLNFLNEILKEKFDIIIAVDKGLNVLDSVGIRPNYIIGDFDSIDINILKEYENKNIEIIKLNPEKDYSDTHMALKLAMKLKTDNVSIVGALGKRIDHALANIHILKETLDSNVQSKILDENNEIQLINEKISIHKNEKYKYISLIPLTTNVTGITLSRFKISSSKCYFKYRS